MNIHDEFKKSRIAGPVTVLLSENDYLAARNAYFYGEDSIIKDKEVQSRTPEQQFTITTRGLEVNFINSDGSI